MKISPNRLFPHPVLWFVNDDYRNSDFTMDFAHEESFGALTLSYEFHLTNNELKERIKANDLSFCLHVECSLTMFRQCYLLHEPSGIVKIDSKNVNGKIDILPSIIANKDLVGYGNSSLHEDYDDVDLRISRGSIMGVSDYCYLFVDKDKSGLGKKDSIFSFVKNQKNEPMQIETDTQKIIIKLKENDFNQLQMLQASRKYQPVIFSMFIVPALIFALDSIDDDVEEMREKLWFRSLEKHFNANQIELTPETIRQKTSYSLSQILLEDPISQALLVLMENGGGEE